MPGYQQIFYNTPPAPPNRCAICQISTMDSVEYFLDTGIWAEHEGVIYLCSKCFEPLVSLTERFIPQEDHSTELSRVMSEVELIKDRAVELQNQADLLHDLFGLRLSDLSKFKNLTAKLDHLNGAVGLIEQRHSERSADEVLELQEVTNRELLLQQLDKQIEERQQELNVFVEASLTTKLEHIGRADLIDLILNNRFDAVLEREVNGSEREIDEDSGIEIESDISFSL